MNRNNFRINNKCDELVKTNLPYCAVPNGDESPEDNFDSVSIWSVNTGMDKSSICSLPLPQSKQNIYKKIFESDKMNKSKIPFQQNSCVDLIDESVKGNVNHIKRVFKNFEEPILLINWYPKLSLTGQLAFQGYDANKKSIRSGYVMHRFSNNRFADVDRIVYLLKGHFNIQTDYPSYICEVFTNGLPVMWQNICHYWQRYYELGEPAMFPWVDMSFYDTNLENNSYADIHRTQFIPASNESFYPHVKGNFSKYSNFQQYGRCRNFIPPSDYVPDRHYEISTPVNSPQNFYITSQLSTIQKKDHFHPAQNSSSMQSSVTGMSDKISTRSIIERKIKKLQAMLKTQSQRELLQSDDSVVIQKQESHRVPESSSAFKPVNKENQKKFQNDTRDNIELISEQTDNESVVFKAPSIFAPRSKVTKIKSSDNLPSQKKNSHKNVQINESNKSNSLNTKEQSLDIKDKHFPAKTKICFSRIGPIITDTEFDSFPESGDEVAIQKLKKRNEKRLFQTETNSKNSNVHSQKNKLSICEDIQEEPPRKIPRRISIPKTQTSETSEFEFEPTDLNVLLYCFQPELLHKKKLEVAETQQKHVLTINKANKKKKNSDENENKHRNDHIITVEKKTNNTSVIDKDLDHNYKSIIPSSSSNLSDIEIYKRQPQTNASKVGQKSISKIQQMSVYTEEESDAFIRCNNNIQHKASTTWDLKRNLQNGIEEQYDTFVKRVYEDDNFSMLTEIQEPDKLEKLMNKKTELPHESEENKEQKGYVKKSESIKKTHKSTENVLEKELDMGNSSKSDSDINLSSMKHIQIYPNNTGLKSVSKGLQLTYCTDDDSDFYDEHSNVRHLVFDPKNAKNPLKIQSLNDDGNISKPIENLESEKLQGFVNKESKEDTDFKTQRKNVRNTKSIKNLKTIKKSTPVNDEYKEDLPMIKKHPKSDVRDKLSSNKQEEFLLYDNDTLAETVPKITPKSTRKNRAKKKIEDIEKNNEQDLNKREYNSIKKHRKYDVTDKLSPNKQEEFLLFDNILAEIVPKITPKNAREISAKKKIEDIERNNEQDINKRENSKQEISYQEFIDLKKKHVTPNNEIKSLKKLKTGMQNENILEKELNSGSQSLLYFELFDNHENIKNIDNHLKNTEISQESEANKIPTPNRKSKRILKNDKSNEKLESKNQKVNTRQKNKHVENVLKSPKDTPEFQINNNIMLKDKKPRKKTKKIKKFDENYCKEIENTHPESDNSTFLLKNCCLNVKNLGKKNFELFIIADKISMVNHDIISNNYKTNPVSVRYTDTKIGCKGGNTYIISGQVCKFNNGFPIALRDKFEKGFPSNWADLISKFSKLPKQTKQKNNENKGSNKRKKQIDQVLNCLQSTSDVDQITSSRYGRSRRPPVKYWTGERLKYVGNNTVYIPSQLCNEKEIVVNRTICHEKVKKSGHSKNKKVISSPIKQSKRSGNKATRSQVSNINKKMIESVNSNKPKSSGQTKINKENVTTSISSASQNTTKGNILDCFVYLTRLNLTSKNKKNINPGHGITQINTGRNILAVVKEGNKSIENANLQKIVKLKGKYDKVTDMFSSRSSIYSTNNTMESFMSKRRKLFSSHEWLSQISF